MTPVEFRGGPLAGQQAQLPTRDGSAIPGQLLLSQVEGSWHCYQLVPFPDSDVDYHLSYLGVVDQLPTLDLADPVPDQLPDEMSDPRAAEGSTMVRRTV